MKPLYFIVALITVYCTNVWSKTVTLSNNSEDDLNVQLYNRSSKIYYPNFGPAKVRGYAIATIAIDDKDTKKDSNNNFEVLITDQKKNAQQSLGQTTIASNATLLITEENEIKDAKSISTSQSVGFNKGKFH